MQHPLLAVRGRPPVVDDSGREPAYLHDLNLDTFVARVTKDRERAYLKAFFTQPLEDHETIRRRQETFEDLDRDAVRDAVTSFTRLRVRDAFRRRVEELREDDGGRLHYFRERLFLDDAMDFCDGVTALCSSLQGLGVAAAALREFVAYTRRYTQSQEFTTLRDDARRLLDALGEVRYCVSIKGSRITVAPYDDEADYGAELTQTLARFRQRQPAEQKPKRSAEWDTYASTGVLDLVAQIHPDLFASLDRFCADHIGYLDETIAGFDYDVQFFLAYLDFIAPLRAQGLRFGYPMVSSDDRQEQAFDTFDLVLAEQLEKKNERVVCNDVELVGPERILVISGPNNGGKTTLARAFGQIHHLARLGCPVPGHDVKLLLCDTIFTHFEREETAETGRLQDELDRLHSDLECATSRSVFILNEVFNGAATRDAATLNGRVLRRLADLDAIGVCVTFIEELSRSTEATVSMVSTVVPDDPATRTFRVERRRADGRAYAHALADKYGLTYERLIEEIGQ